MTALYVFTRGGLSLDDLEGIEQSQEPLAALDVGLRRMQLCQRGVAD